MEIQSAFISGATGFIGGSIAERLWLDRGIAARCLVRNYSHAARLARLPVTMIHGDLLDSVAVRKAMEGCDSVFHCAYGNTGNAGLNARIDEEGTRILGEIAIEMGVPRFLYLSSVAVYGAYTPDVVDEETPTQTSDDEYGNRKIQAESICSELAEKGLPVVIIRPSVVYGPFSPIWTIGAAGRVRIGGWENVTGVNGFHNPVYIDDLVDFLFSSIEDDQAAGQTFIVSGNEPVTWNDFFGAYAELAGIPSVKTISKSRRKLLSLVRNPAQRTLGLLRRVIEPLLVEVYSSSKERFPRLTSYVDRLLRGGLRSNEIPKFSRKTVFSNAKARNLLGFSPRSFDEGMRITAEWLAHHEYI